MARGRIFLRVRQWLEQASIPALRRQALTLRDVVEKHPPLLAVVAERMQQEWPSSCQEKLIARFIGLVLELTSVGLRVLDDGPLASVLQERLSEAIDKWSLHSLGEELRPQHGAVAKLLGLEGDTLQLARIRAAISARLAREGVDIAASISCSEDIPQTQRRLSQWVQIVQLAQGASFASFDEALRAPVAEEFSNCRLRFVASPRLANVALAVQEMQSTALALLGQPVLRQNIWGGSGGRRSVRVLVP